MLNQREQLELNSTFRVSTIYLSFVQSSPFLPVGFRRDLDVDMRASRTSPNFLPAIGCLGSQDNANLECIAILHYPTKHRPINNLVAFTPDYFVILSFYIRLSNAVLAVAFDDIMEALRNGSVSRAVQLLKMAKVLTSQDEHNNVGIGIVSPN